MPRSPGGRYLSARDPDHQSPATPAGRRANTNASRDTCASLAICRWRRATRSTARAAWRPTTTSKRPAEVLPGPDRPPVGPARRPRSTSSTRATSRALHLRILSPDGGTQHYTDFSYSSDSNCTGSSDSCSDPDTTHTRTADRDQQRQLVRLQQHWLHIFIPLPDTYGSVGHGWAVEQRLVADRVQRRRRQRHDDVAGLGHRQPGPPHRPLTLDAAVAGRPRRVSPAHPPLRADPVTWTSRRPVRPRRTVGPSASATQDLGPVHLGTPATPVARSRPQPLGIGGAAPSDAAGRYQRALSGTHATQLTALAYQQDLPTRG